MPYYWNMKISKLIYILVLSLSILLTTNSQVLAEDSEDKYTRWEKREENMQERQEKMEDRRESMDQKREEIKENRAEKRCEVIGNMIDNRLNSYDKNKGDHITQYNKLKDRLTEISSRLAEKGLDVIELNADLVTFDSMVKNYAAKYVEFIDVLKSSKDLVCGESEGAYKDKMTEAREMLKGLKQLREEIRSFYIDELRQDIKVLRDQLEEMVADDSNESEESSENVEGN